MAKSKCEMKLRRARTRKLRNARTRKRIVEGQQTETNTGLLNVVRCGTVLKSGKQCTRKAKKKIEGMWCCWQHGKN